MRNPIPHRASVAVAALLLSGCQGYVASNAPPAPGFDVVRIPFARPQVVLLARADAADAPPDTLRGVTAVYGRVLELRGDTLRMVVTQVGRSGALQHYPSGRHAAVDLRAATGVQRWDFSQPRTTSLAVVFGALVITAVAVFAVFISYVEG